MKNILKNTAKGILMVALLATTMSFANEAKLYTIKDSKKTALVIDHVNEGNTLVIKDQNGIVLYSELIAANGIYKKAFDLTELPDGNYFFEVEKDLEFNTIPFSVKANQVVFNKEKEETFFKPFVRQANNMVYVSQLTPNKENTKISIYAQYGDEFELMHTEEIKNVQVAERTFKIPANSNYKIVVNSNNKEYTKFIKN